MSNIYLDPFLSFRNYHYFYTHHQLIAILWNRTDMK